MRKDHRRRARRPERSRPARRTGRISQVEEERLVKKLLAERDITLKQIVILQGRSSNTNRDSSVSLSTDPYHITDMGSDAVERERLFQLISGLRRKLRIIDEALENIYKKQDYGVCRRCEKPIQKKRLRVIPYTMLCFDCQKSQESYSTFE